MDEDGLDEYAPPVEVPTIAVAAAAVASNRPAKLAGGSSVPNGVTIAPFNGTDMSTGGAGGTAPGATIGIVPAGITV